MPNSIFRGPLALSLMIVAGFFAFSGSASAQGKGKDKAPKPREEKKEEPSKFTGSPPPKAVDEAISKNADKMKKDCQTLSEKMGSEVHGAQGTMIAITLEEPTERATSLTKMGEAMVYELAPELDVDPLQDLWAKNKGPFNLYLFKTKASFGDAYREFLEKRFASYGLAGENERKRILEIGRFIREEPGPLGGGEVTNYEEHLAHMVGQMVAHYMANGRPLLKQVKTGDDGKPAYTGPTKEEIEQMKGEQQAWLHEGFAMYCSVRFVGRNAVYCVSDSRYVGKTGMADKDLDTSYRLVCLEMAQGEEDKAKDFATIIKTETNALNYLDLAKSWSFFDWMMRPENRANLSAVMKGMRNGSFQGSLKRNTGMSLSDLESKWKEFVLKEYGGKKKSTPPDPKNKKPDPKDPKKK
jgi:hypothetical protein